MRYSEGLIVAHVGLALSFLIGASFLRPHNNGSQDDSAPQNMVRVVCTCGLGFAIIGFAGLLLALIGLFNAPAFLVALAACAAAGSIYRKESPFAAAYWGGRLRLLASCWDGPSLSVYYLMLATAFPAVDLKNLGTDPLAYHLAYAVDWAFSGRLVVDPFLDPPFYASNFSVLDGVLLLFHAQAFAIFLVWTTGLLTALGIFATARWILIEREIRSVLATLAAFFLTVAVVFAPTYFRWLTSAYVDVPIGAFALLGTLSIVLGVRVRDPRWLFAGAVTSGFLIGMKGSFLPIVAVFVLVLLIAARELRLKRGLTIALLGVLVMASSPWYVRNWIMAGDPIAPILNLTLYGHDGLMTPSEAASLAAGLHRVKSPTEMLTLPFRAFANNEGHDFAGDGTSALIVALYLPAALLLLAVTLGLKRVGKDTLIAALVLYLLVAYWMLTSTTLRYASVFAPLLAVCVAMTAGLPFLRRSWRETAIVILAALTMIPTADTVGYFNLIYNVDYAGLPGSYVSDSVDLPSALDGYKEVGFIAALPLSVRGSGLVYVLMNRGQSLNYYFRLHGIRNVGDWVGPGGWFRLFAAIDAGAAPKFLDDLGVTTVLVDPTNTLGGLGVPFVRQIASHGYCREPMPQSSLQLYVRCKGRP